MDIDKSLKLELKEDKLIDVLMHAATREDIAAAHNELKEDIVAVRNELRTEVVVIRNDITDLHHE